MKPASNAIDVNKVQFLYTIAIGSLQEMMNAGIELANEIKSKIKFTGLSITARNDLTGL